MRPDPIVARRERSGRAGLAVGLMLLGTLLFSLNDVLGKWLVGTYSPAQILFIRSIAVILILAPLMAREGLGTAVRLERPGLQVTRAVFSTVDVFCFYTAVIYLPLAEVMAFYLAAPIFVAAMSPFLLGERVGWRRWSAILAGFIGVLIALGPSAAGLNGAAGVALLGSLAFSLMLVATRSLGATGDKVLVFWQTVGALAAGLVMAPFNWTPPSAPDYLLIALLGVVSMSGHLCVTRSLKLAPAATVVPYQYTLILWAIIFGYLVFGDVPTSAMLVGTVIIIAAGLFIFWREQVSRAATVRADATAAHRR